MQASFLNKHHVCMMYIVYVDFTDDGSAKQSSTQCFLKV